MYLRAALAAGCIGAVFFAARTDLLWGRMLAKRQGPGDAELAHLLLSKARTTAEDRGYANVALRAGQALEGLEQTI